MKKALNYGCRETMTPAVMKSHLTKVTDLLISVMLVSWEYRKKGIACSTVLYGLQVFYAIQLNRAPNGRGMLKFSKCGNIQL